MQYSDTDAALAAFQRALALDPQRATTHYNLGLIYTYRDSADLAEQTYLAALDADSTLAPAYKKLGLLYRKQGATEQALTYLRQAIRHDPEDAEGLFHMGLLHSAQGQYQEALATLEKVVSLNPYSPQVHTNLGGIYLRLGRREEGRRHLERSEFLRQFDRGLYSELSMPTTGHVPIGPATARYNMALNHALRGDYERAELEYRNVIELNAEHKNAHISLGILLTWKAAYDEAIYCLQKGIALDQEDAISHMRLGGGLSEKRRLRPGPPSSRTSHPPRSGLARSRLQSGPGGGAHREPSGSYKPIFQSDLIAPQLCRSLSQLGRCPHERKTCRQSPARLRSVSGIRS